jgi:predicted porin
MKLNKKVLAGLVAFAAANSAQAVTVMAEDGWTLGVSGQVNQFITFQEDKASNTDSSTVANGLLPTFLTFRATAPEMNGLKMAAQFSFNPGTNNPSGSAQEQREAFFTVDGSFGQILAGKAIGLYGAKNLLTEQTLFGVGLGPANGGSTSLGGIGSGYDYMAWRSQVRWTSNDMNGFKIALAVAHPAAADSTLVGGVPTGSNLNSVTTSEDLRYEAELSYAGAFDGGSYSAWLAAMSQDQDTLADDKSAWTVGGTLSVSGFEFMAQYSDSEGASTTQALEWDQYIIQAGYRFNGTTLVSANYSEVDDKTAGVNNELERYTIGVYHDVNSNLKLVAEYSQAENDLTGNNAYDVELFSIGGFVFF